MKLIGKIREENSMVMVTSLNRSFANFAYFHNFTFVYELRIM